MCDHSAQGTICRVRYDLCVNQSTASAKCRQSNCEFWGGSVWQFSQSISIEPSFCHQVKIKVNSFLDLRECSDVCATHNTFFCCLASSAFSRTIAGLQATGSRFATTEKSECVNTARSSSCFYRLTLFFIVCVCGTGVCHLRNHNRSQVVDIAFNLWRVGILCVWRCRAVVVVRSYSLCTMHTHNSAYNMNILCKF